MTQCPLDHSRINESVVRVCAGLTVVVVLVALFSQSALLIGLLALDFAARRFAPTFSLLGWLARESVARLKLPKKLIDGGPKRFAALLGLIAMVLAFVALLSGFTAIGWAIAGLIALFSFLEAAFGLCVACVAYGYLSPLWTKGESRA